MIVIGVYMAVRALLYFTGWDGHNNVYVCKGPNSYAYHRFKYCAGLKDCSGSLSKVNIYFAKDSLGRKECGYCRQALDEIEAEDRGDNLRP